MAETVTTNQFRNGMHIQLEGSVWRIIEFQHVKPGKGGAFVRSRLRSLDSARSSTRPSAPAEVPADPHRGQGVQYLYDSGDEVIFMDTGTYEQFSLPHATVEDALPYLEPSSTCRCSRSTASPRACSSRRPSSGGLETEPGVRGDTVSNVTKPATLETGAVVQVPLFVNVGDRIKVDPREGRYISRA